VYGATRRSAYRYYRCPALDRVAQGHLRDLSVREESLLDGLERFLTEHVFGPQRRTLLDEALSEEAELARQTQHERLAELRLVLKDLDLRRTRLVRNLELSDDPALVRDIQTRLAELRANQLRTTAALRGLEDHTFEQPVAALLDELPLGNPDLSLPEAVLRPFFEVARLEIRYDKRTHTALYRVHLVHEYIDLVRQTSQALLTDQSGIIKPHDTVIGWSQRPTVAAPARLTVQARLGLK
jgi:site-specific DNA recombinase